MNSQFAKDFSKQINYDGRQMPVAFYNLVVCKQQVSLFCKGLIPYRGWRLKDVKAYFGIKGNKDRVLEQLTDLLGNMNDSKKTDK